MYAHYVVGMRIWVVNYGNFHIFARDSGNSYGNVHILPRISEIVAASRLADLW